MCIFTQPVEAVSDTRIFARAAGPGRQYLAYEMSFGAREDLAMVLPLPVASRDERTAVRFIDLSGAPGFFDRLGKLIVMYEEVSLGGGDGLMEHLSFGAEIRPPLLVHEVGAFDASFVPSIGDFGRLDARFRLSPDVWAALPAQYKEYGFAVFQLRATNGKAPHAHPMSFEFSSRIAPRLFVPTVHVHDGGSVPRLAWFDHMVYAQAIRWPPAQAGYYDGGVRGEGEKKEVLKRVWSALRVRGDWRYRDADGEHEKGIMLCGRIGDALADMRLHGPVEELWQRWQKAPPEARAQIIRIIEDVLLLAGGDNTPEEVVRALCEATPAQRQGWAAVRRWSDLSRVLNLQAIVVENWKDLDESDRARVLRGEAPAGDDIGAVIWRKLEEKQRLNFGRLYRWPEAHPLLETFGQEILAWMTLPIERREIAAKVGALKRVFSVFERHPALASAHYGKMGGTANYRKVSEALLETEPRSEQGTREFLADVAPGTWWMIPGMSALDSMAPLFDPTQKLYALGLSGMLANEDMFLDTA